jgi:hypothetical protein
MGEHLKIGHGSYLSHVFPFIIYFIRMRATCLPHLIHPNFIISVIFKKKEIDWVYMLTK